MIGDNGSGKTTILEAITKGFVPVLRTVNAEAMKECDLTNKDIRNGANGAAVTLDLLADNFFRFWYRFVPVNMSAIDSGRIAKTYPHAVKQYLPDYMGLIFEKMCQELVWMNSI